MKNVKLIGRLEEDGSLVYPSSMTDREAWDAYADDMAALGLTWSKWDGDGPVMELTPEDRAKWERENADYKEYLHFTSEESSFFNP